MDNEIEITYVVEFGDGEEEPQSATFIDLHEAEDCFVSLKRVSLFSHVTLTRITRSTYVTVLERKTNNV